MPSHEHPYADPTADPTADAFAASTQPGPADGLSALPGWLRRPVRSWGVTRTEQSWVSGSLGGVATRYGLDPLLVRGVFAAACLLSAGLALLAYAAAWTVLPGPDGRVLYAQLRRRDLSGAGVGVAAVGGVGLVSLFSGVGLTATVVAGGGLTALAGLAGVGLLVWWLATRWDPKAQRPSASGGSLSVRVTRRRDTEGPGSSVRTPAWYMSSRQGAPQQDDEADEAGFRSSWIDPETGQWRERPHSRERRAAERVAELEREAAREREATRERALAARAPRPALGLLPQSAAVVLAGALSVTVMAAVGLFGIEALGTFGVAAMVIAGGAAALMVLAPVLLLAALRGRRAGLVSVSSALAVGMVAAGVLMNLTSALV